ncbi:MAG: hypothetical protein QM777_15955 [Pseudorhodoferax sp.]
MASPYDTPPDGDFARYIEQLSRRPPPQAGVPPGPVPKRPPRTPLPRTGPAPARAFAPLRQVAQGALFLYVAWLMLSAAWPLLVPWGGLVGLAYLVFAFLRLRKLPWRDLLQQKR